MGKEWLLWLRHYCWPHQRFKTKQATGHTQLILPAVELSECLSEDVQHASRCM